MTYLCHILIILNIYASLGIALNLLVGYTGLLSLSQAVFLGVGAYSTALMTHSSIPCSWPLSILVGIGISSIMALIIGAISLRFRDDLFAIATFSFQVIIYNLMQNLTGITEGPLGISGIPSPRIGCVVLTSYWAFLVLSLVFAIVSIYIARRAVLAPYGRLLRAIREDEISVTAMAKNTATLRVSTFVFASMISSIAGSLYASYLTYIDPSIFTVQESIFILAIVIIGGPGRLWGPVLGAALLVSLPEGLRLLGLPSSVAANTRQILYGAALVGCMIWRPQGLVGKYSLRSDERG